MNQTTEDDLKIVNTSHKDLKSLDKIKNILAHLQPA